MNSNINDQRIERLKNKASRLPLEPGVYIMRDKEGNIIYIGKAIHLKNRVSQYFGFRADRDPKVQQMIDRVEEFEYIVCDSEFEALILECSLIKQHTPKYNILLKDDKGYHYIRIGKEGWGDISAVKQKSKADKTASYIGPYNSFAAVSRTVEEAKKIFKLPQCKKGFPKDINPRRRPCLNYDLGLCAAPCNGSMSREEYTEALEGAIAFVKNDSAEIVKKLKSEMMAASENMEYEKAAKLRDRIHAIEAVKNRQKIVASPYKNQDVIALAAGTKKVAVEVFTFRDSRLCDRGQYLFDKMGDEGELRSQFIAEYYSKKGDIPAKIYIDKSFEGIESMAKMLSQISGRQVTLNVPQKGRQKELVNMCAANAGEFLTMYLAKEEHSNAALEELAGLLGLEKIPEYIESYDISHTSGSENVGAMVVFQNGKPLKSAYKRFKIKGFSGQDDCRSMAEVLSRRFGEYIAAETDAEQGFGRLPDLILLDGGKGQLEAVKAVMDQMGINVPVFGMVKDSKHKTSAIAADGGNVAIKANRRAFGLLYTIQEEVHRFAIGYHRERRSKAMLKSSLLQIEGIGPKKAAALMKKFGNIEKISVASPQELASVKGIGKSDAEAVAKFFSES